MNYLPGGTVLSPWELVLFAWELLTAWEALGEALTAWESVLSAWGLPTRRGTVLALPAWGLALLPGVPVGTSQVYVLS